MKGIQILPFTALVFAQPFSELLLSFINIIMEMHPMLILNYEILFESNFASGKF